MKLSKLINGDGIKAGDGKKLKNYQLGWDAYSVLKNIALTRFLSSRQQQSLSTHAKLRCNA